MQATSRKRLCRLSLRLAGISKGTVSRLCKDIDGRVQAFLDRSLVGDWPCLWLGATYLKQREGGQIVSVAAMTAVAANGEGKREVVGLHVKPRGLPDVGPSEAEAFWSTFLKSLVRRGLRGVKLVSPDTRAGLKAATRRVMGAAWQGCRAHWVRNALAYVPKGRQSTVAAALRQAFGQPDQKAAQQTWRHVADQLPHALAPGAFAARNAGRGTGRFREQGTDRGRSARRPHGGCRPTIWPQSGTQVRASRTERPRSGPAGCRRVGPGTPLRRRSCAAALCTVGPASAADAARPQASPAQRPRSAVHCAGRSRR